VCYFCLARIDLGVVLFFVVMCLVGVHVSVLFV
jgi:hypothetical protein